MRSQNLYTYVGNNPINYIDSTGHTREDDERYAGENPTADWWIRQRKQREKEITSLFDKDGLHRTMDDATVAWANYVMPTSVHMDREIGGLIYKKMVALSDGTSIAGYGHAGFEIGEAHTVQPLNIDAPEGTTIVAYTHTHGADSNAKHGTSYQDWKFSDPDKNFAQKTTGLPFYMVYEFASHMGAELMVIDPTDSSFGSKTYNGRVVNSSINRFSDSKWGY